MIKYLRVKKAVFINRPNRFIANATVCGERKTVHVKNTGRCRELLVEGCDVVLSESDNANRKTKYDLIAVYKQRQGKPPLLINMDSQIPNDVAEEWLRNGNLFSIGVSVCREVKFGNSRFDFYVEDGERKAFVEVKGVTLENDGIAMFPDAPTERGIKHINELVEAKKQGYEAYILFVVQMKGIYEMRPNDATHKAFGDALRNAFKNGVRVLAVDCNVTEQGIEADKLVPVKI